MGSKAWFRQRLEFLRSTKSYDFLTALPLIAWFGFSILYQAPVLAQQISATNFATADMAFIASLAAKLSTLVFVGVFALLLVLRHKPQARINGLYPRIAAMAGTYLGVGIVVMVPARELPAPVALLSTLLVLVSTAVSIYVVLWLGRSLSLLPEARRLVTRGPYSLVRHPLYLSEAVGLAGLMLQYFSPLALALAALQCLFQFERMKNEERVLSSTFPEYRSYMTTTARLVPGVY